jgi:uncharacterized 2Fe-2S/4Fe-4S cluster protein (DUF4445 family)
VRVIEGEVPVDQNATHQLPLADLAAGWRLACTTQISGDCSVSVPRESLQEEIVAVYADAWNAIEPATGLIWRDLSLPPPSLTDQRSDQQRLRDALSLPGLRMPLGLLATLPTRLRACARHRAVLRGEELVALLPPGDCVLGIACDLGTTTMVVAIFDLATGERLAEASAPNPQQTFGADVVSRMGHAVNDSKQATALRRTVITGIQALIGDLCQRRAVDARSIARMVIAGNTAMQHLLLGLDVRGMVRAPFVPTTLTGLRLSATELGFTLACGAEVLVTPGIAAYVGGDIVAGLLARRCDEAGEGAILFIDIGTNGELVLIHGGRMLACATAAGPAFEGAGISCGMRARPGAIDRVRLVEGDLEVRVVGDVVATGLCGSGLVEAVAALLDGGIVDETGLLLDADEYDGPLAARLCQHDGAAAVRLAGAVCLTQRDLRQLQLAKAAIAAGIEVLIARAGLVPAELAAVVLAGGFGYHLDHVAAQRIGLLPAGLNREQIHVVGNTSLAGARLCLLREDCWQRAERIALACQGLELSGQADFEEAYVEAMEFPEPA